MRGRMEFGKGGSCHNGQGRPVIETTIFEVGFSSCSILRGCTYAMAVQCSMLATDEWEWWLEEDSPGCKLTDQDVGNRIPTVRSPRRSNC